MPIKVIFSCIFPVNYVFHMRNTVTRLEEENINLCRWCSETDVVGNNGNEVLQPGDNSSLRFFL